MNEFSDSLRFEEDVIDEESWSLCEEDFNSEDAFCEELSEGEGPCEIEILGMDLLLVDDGEEIESDTLDDSENDGSEMPVEEALFRKRTIDSLELTRERLPHLVIKNRKSSTTKRRQKQRKFYPTTLPGGEVDSLVLARERMPGLVHFDERKARLMNLYEEGRGLMGEVDSLKLDKQRLPHLVHKRPETPKKQRKPRVTKDAYSELSSHLEYRVQLSGDNDYDSTSSTESETSDSDTLFSSDTVDSLILARKRLNSHRRRPYRIPDVFIEDDLRTWSSGESLGPKIPPKPGVGLGLGLRKTSSGACAA